MGFTTNSVPFLPIKVSDELLAEAVQLRQKRDQQYQNIYEAEETDLRWCGDLGELVLLDWFREHDVHGNWHRDDAAGKPDFTVAGVAIDVKTVKRKDPPLLSYTGQITARHRDAPVDVLFFCCYVPSTKTMWLLGGVEKHVFLANATFYGPGEKVHSHYTVRDDHGILNAPLAILTLPLDWIMQFKPKHT